MDKVIVVDHLSYLSQLKDISFTIQSGEMVGIIGSRESGKILMLKILSGLLKPSSGFVSVIDHDPFLKSPDFLKQISFSFEINSQLFHNLAPIDILEITKEVYGLSTRDFNRSLNDLAKYVLDPMLIDSLIYKPKVVILDRLNTDLNQLYEYNTKNQATVIISEDKIDNLIGLVRRTIILNEGQLVFDGAIDEVIEKYAKEKVIKAKLSSEIDIKDVKEIGVIKKYVFPNLQVLAPRAAASFAAAEMLQKMPITDLTIEELSIEEIINNMEK